MVNTRHSRDPEIDSPTRFLSLEDKRSRKPRSHAVDLDDHESDQSGIVYEDKDQDHSIFEDKVVESRLRPRTGPRRAYNYVYGDSSDDEIMSRGRRSRMMSQDSFKLSRREAEHHNMRQSQTDHSSDDEEPERNRWYRGKRRGKVHGRPRPQPLEDDDDEPDGDVHEEEEEEEEDDEDEDDMNNSALRRSSRLRQKPYRFRPSSRDEAKGGNPGNVDRGKRRRGGDSNEDFEDMYSRVKRSRTRKGSADGQEEQLVSNSDGTNDDKNSEDETQQRRSYSLREHKPRTQLYIAPAIEAKKRPKQQPLFRETPPRRIPKQASYRSPAHRRNNFRKRQAFHGNSSSTSSDSSDSGTETSDEQRFSRRKNKSMAKARARICPLNFDADMLSSSGVLKDRVRTGASLADVDPMEIDKSVTFESVGGLKKHIMTLKEMVVFPLLYPEFYERFKVAPSRGVLFYGPPGTGKTLVARALANECSKGTQRVAFFMRKGADCLSKWVGEAERQLRLLFDKAYEMRPSIIFFDEIDGLAPVRSSRQDQIHSSIVSTLLALMDGIDSRGEIVVIGATNRIDSIDPALRRPGRFDREFHFPLPNVEDRKKILKIHTKNWSPSLRDDFVSELAEKCAGYCGADIKCLVTDATQNALRRHYPQIYTTSDKLQLDVSAITLTARDFAQAMSSIVPAAQRAQANPAVALEASVRPLLSRTLLRLQTSLAGRFPYSKLNPSTPAHQGGPNAESLTLQDINLPSDEEDNAPSIFLPAAKGGRLHSPQLQTNQSFMRFSLNGGRFPVVFRPRMLVCGVSGQGQTVHLAPAALHLMEHLPVHTLCSSTLFAASAKMPEEACANVFHEAKRTAPSVIYIPYMNELWGVVSDSLRVTFLTLVRSMNPATPILLLATSETPYTVLHDTLRSLFSQSGGEVVEVEGPNAEERRQFFSDLILQQTVRPPPTHRQAARRVLEPLAKAPPPEPRKLTNREQKLLNEQEDDTLRELRIFLRDILSKLGREKKFSIFTKPVDIEEVPDYYEIIKKPMDLSTMMSKIDLHSYNTASAFLEDIFLICSNALEYNPDRGPTDRAIRHRACSLRDTAQALLKAELDPEFERLCREITQSRKRRGVDSSKTAPDFYRTRPAGAASTPASFDQLPLDGLAAQSSAAPEGCRYSRRVRGLDADRTLPLEAVERTVQVEKNLLRKDSEEDDAAELVGAGGEYPQAVDASLEASRGDKVCHSVDRAIAHAGLDSPKDRTDCQCPKSTKGPSPSLVPSVKSKAGPDAKYSASSAAKKASIRKRCPWLATRRRRRHHTAPAHRQAGTSPAWDGEEPSADESIDIGPGGHLALSPRCHKLAEEEEALVERSRRAQRDHSPLSAANPANVNQACPSRGPRRHSQHIPAPPPTPSPEMEGSKEKGAESQPPATTAPAAVKKPGASRSLNMDLVVVATDSGVGSESNGDSRDSLDHNNSNRTGSKADDDNREVVEEDTTTSASGPSLARTRSRTQTSLQLSALAAMEAEVVSVTVERSKLGELLEVVVERTQGCSVERLQQLYSVLSCAVFNHRHNTLKAHLLQDMEDIMESFCQEQDCH